MDKEIKYNGYTATPSDYESPDGDLVGIINGVPEDGGIRPIFSPSEVFTAPSGTKVLLIHKGSSYKHYVVQAPGPMLQWCESPDYTLQGGVLINGDVTAIEAIGNTIVYSDESGMNYLLWDGDAGDYVALGKKPPRLDIRFGLRSELCCYPSSDVAAPVLERRFDDDEIPIEAPSGNSDWTILPDNYPELLTQDFENRLGKDGEDAVNNFISDMSQWAFSILNPFVQKLGVEQNKFVMPFFIRYAYEMYDGTLIMHSTPVLLIPNSRGPVLALYGGRNTEDNDFFGLKIQDTNQQQVLVGLRGRAYGFVSTLWYSYSGLNTMGLEKWKDIVKGVSFYVTAPVYPYDQSGKVTGWHSMTAAGSWDSFYTTGNNMACWANPTSGSYANREQFFDRPFLSVFNDDSRVQDGSGSPSQAGCFYMRPRNNASFPHAVMTLPYRTEEEMRNLLASAGVFYKIADWKLEDITAAGEGEFTIKDNLLKTLVNRAPMQDDFQTHDVLKPGTLYGYNGRLNVSGVTQQLHSPMPLSTMVSIRTTNTAGIAGGVTPDSYYRVAVYSKHEGKTCITVNTQDTVPTWFEAVSNTARNAPHYLFVPDPEAYKLVVCNGSTSGFKHTFDLTKHELLNGAYWLGHINRRVNTMEQDVVDGDADTTFPTAKNTEVKRANKIYTSEVNNPFYFPVTGINTVGTGEIMAICSATKALSQGQFGQFPLYAFTTEGVWALETSSTGTFSARQPVTRDVCTNAESITQLDDSVLFATDRGIMLLSGSNTLCITDEINNTTPIDLGLPAAVATLSGISMPTIARFTEYLKGARMAYDYTGQRIIVFNPTATAYSYAYVFSLKDKKWGMMESTLSYPIHSYPEALAVTKNNKLVNLSQDVNSNESAGDDVQTGSMLLVTRPLKLDQGDVLKTVREVIQRGKFDYLQSGRSPKPVRSLLMGSRDLYHWHMIWSSQDHYLRGFSGTPYKYFRIVVLGSLAPDESLFGCTVRYEPKMTNQMR